MKKTCTFLLVTFFIISAGTGLSQDGHPLPFLEQWNLGTFETNNWLADGANWSINWQEGQPSPSAQFTWDPIQADYQLALESYPLLADSLTEGSIYLDFILKLDNYLATGTEQMLVQVWNWDTQVWNTVSAYSNEDGSFGWLPEHINITDQAMDKVFKIRFAATGESSLNILGWYVDNTHVYRECICPDHVETILYAGADDPGIKITWDDLLVVDEWIEWDDGIWSENAIGTGGEIEFDAAARWEPAQLSGYDGDEVQQVAFIPSESLAEYRIRIWVGSNAANLIVDQPVENPTIDQWNYVTLTSPVLIDVTQELWVGYHVMAMTGHPAGVDNGPAIDGYGNMMNFGGWQTLLEINDQLNYNWNIKALVHRNGDTNSVTKYAIYRQDDDGPLYLRAYSEENQFIDYHNICWGAYVHCYKITAIYESPTDTCESPMPDSFACEICMSANEMESGSELKIYPNPASDVLYIESAEEIKSVSIFDSRGGSMETGRQGDWETGRQGDKETGRQGDGEN